MSYNDETFVIARNELNNALQEFKRECEESSNGEVFEDELENLVDDLE